MPTRRCVVVGDVVASRRVEDRAALRDVLADGIDRTNEALEERLVAPFATLKGVDEVGGVLESLAGSYRAVRTLVEAIHPTEMRFAVVWGEVDVGTDDRDVAKQDGPAFHAADRLLADLADADRYVCLAVEGSDDVGGVRNVHSTDTRPGRPRELDRRSNPYVATIGNQMDLLCMWKSGWTERQAEVVRRYRDAETMAEVADRLDVTVQTVSKTLHRADAKRIAAIEADLEETLAVLAEEVR